MSILRTLALIVFALNGTAVAEWQADAGDATQLKAQTAIVETCKTHNVGHVF